LTIIADPIEDGLVKAIVDQEGVYDATGFKVANERAKTIGRTGFKVANERAKTIGREVVPTLP
jgi:hypothetical protein